MARVKGGPASHARHRKVIKSAKGYWGRRKNTFRIANQAVEKAGQLASDIFDYIASFSKEEFMPVDAGSELATRNPEEQYRYAPKR